MARRSDRWQAHPWLAWGVRIAVVLVPVLVSLLVAALVIALLPRPETPLGHVGWWAAVLGSAYLAALGVDRLARRALPLAVLLTLSLVFPDRAPSRLRTARRTSLREIETQVAELHAAGAAAAPAEAAHALVALVGALGLHDKRTRGHSERVRAYVDMLTEELGLDEDDRVRLRWAALLHDIGKLSVPAPVLNGGRDLAEDEWAALRRHPDEGERIAGGLMPWLGQWGLCVREHHERWDGTGYPQGLSGTQISLGARIVAVADAYEVMTANRSYQKAISPAAAREELSRCAGRDFDPAVVRAFLHISLGRLRGVLGPLSFLPAAPFLVTDRVGDAAKGMTTVAAVSAVAISMAPAVVQRPLEPAVGTGEPVVTLPLPETVAAPLPLASAAPRPTPAVRRVLPRPVRPSAPPAKAPEAPPPVVVPLPDTPTPLYLAARGALASEPPDAGSTTLRRRGPARFGVVLDRARTVGGVPTVVIHHRVTTRDATSDPQAKLVVTVFDCVAGMCSTLTRGSAVLAPGTGFVEQVIPLSRVNRVVAAGHELRLTLRLVSRSNVSKVELAYGGSMPSRLLLP